MAKMNLKQRNARTIDLTTEKVAGPVKVTIGRIDRHIQDQIAEANIPVLKVMSKVINLQSYFLDHMNYNAILGNNVEILDRMITHAICTEIANGVYDGIKETKGYIGVWDQNTIYNIAAAVITFMQHDTEPVVYLTAHQYKTISEEDLKNLPVGTYMAFHDYNPNRFYQIFTQIRALVIETIQGIMRNRIPKAFTYSPDYPLATRLYDSYRSFLETDMLNCVNQIKPLAEGTDETQEDREYRVYEVSEKPATEKLITKVTEYFEKPFLTMMTLMLQDSGLSQNVINLMLGTSRIHIFYDDPKDKQLKDINLTYTVISDMAGADGKPFRIEFVVKIGDLLIQCLTDRSKMSKTRLENYGKPIRKFLLDFIAYTLNVYSVTIQSNLEADESSAVEIEEPAQDEVQEMDLGDFEAMLNPSTEDSE